MSSLLLVAQQIYMSSGLCVCVFVWVCPILPTWELTNQIKLQSILMDFIQLKVQLMYGSVLVLNKDLHDQICGN